MFNKGTPVVIAYILLFVATLFVNKYVLSVLQFQYPTIFQGWQTLVGAAMMRVLYKTGQIDISSSEYSRVSLIPWIPAVMLFVISIYSGSKALAVLPVPIFVSLHGITSIVTATGHMAIHRKVTDGGNYLMLMALLMSATMVAWTDPQYSGNGYGWMMIHILSSGSYNTYSLFVKRRIKLGALDRLFCNYVYSIILLAPSSFFLGDALAAVQYPFLYFYRFYVGCVCSGIFGVFYNVCRYRLKESSHYSSFALEQLTGFAKFVATISSFSLFEMEVTVSNSFWILVNLLAGVLIYEEPYISHQDTGDKEQKEKTSMPEVNTNVHTV